MAVWKQYEQVLVRNVEEDSHLTISFFLRGHCHHLHRPKDEFLEKTLKRLTLSVVKADKKKHNRHEQLVTSLPPPPSVSLLEKNGKDLVSLDTVNILAWQEGVWLVVDKTRYQVEVNYPVVKKFEVPTCIMVECPIVPQVELEFADLVHCKWEWLQLQEHVSVDSLETDSYLEVSTLDSAYFPSALTTAVPLHKEMIYCPTMGDLGHQFLIKLTPCSSDRHGNPVYLYTSIVSARPELKAISRRQGLTPALLSSPDVLRVISYNILADQHSTSDYAYQVLYPYCKHEALQSDYRHNLLITEVIGYHPDVICMQEVALKCFNMSLYPVMKEHGYDGQYAMKTGQLQEGEAIFFSTFKYKLVKTLSVSLKKFIQEDPSCSDLFQALQKAPSVLKNLKKKPTIVQIVLLKVLDVNDDRYLLIANTHLCYHPTEGHMRLLQAILCTRALGKVLCDFRSSIPKLDQEKIAVLFCGDFNSCPCTGAYEFLTHGSLSQSHPDWTTYKYSLIPRCGCCEVPPEEAGYIVNFVRVNSDTVMENEEVECEYDGEDGPVSFAVTDDFDGMDIDHEFHLQDACSPLPYTHYRVEFKAVLDYILFDRDHFVIERVIPLPSHEEVTEHTALPSVCFPSDHLPLICELKWK